MQDLQHKVLNWAKDKGILEHATPLAQIDKTLEEVLETRNAILNDDREEIIDGFGDVLVTVIIGCAMQGITVEYALETAYNVISKRTGKMVDGQFVKDKP